MGSWIVQIVLHEKAGGNEDKSSYFSVHWLVLTADSSENSIWSVCISIFVSVERRQVSGIRTPNPKQKGSIRHWRCRAAHPCVHILVWQRNQHKKVDSTLFRQYRLRKELKMCVQMSLTTLPFLFLCFWFRRKKCQNLKSSFSGEFMFSLKLKYGCWYCPSDNMNIQNNIMVMWEELLLQYFECLCYQWHSTNIYMTFLSYLSKMRCPLNLVFENFKYLWFYWTFLVVISNGGLKLPKLSIYTIVMLQKWLKIHSIIVWSSLCVSFSAIFAMQKVKQKFSLRL